MTTTYAPASPSLASAARWIAAQFNLPQATSARTAMRSRMGAFNATGHGNRAAKRAAKIETAAWFDLHAPGLTEADVDALAARYAEEQGARRLFPHATSFHD